MCTCKTVKQESERCSSDAKKQVLNEWESTRLIYIALIVPKLFLPQSVTRWPGETIPHYKAPAEFCTFLKVTWGVSVSCFVYGFSERLKTGENEENQVKWELPTSPHIFYLPKSEKPPKSTTTSSYSSNQTRTRANILVAMLSLYIWGKQVQQS